MSALDASQLQQSLDYCRWVARTKARNFYYGMKLTPEPRRSALYAVYAFMRACDDLADETPPGKGREEVQAQRIEQFRSAMQQVIDGRPVSGGAAFAADTQLLATCMEDGASVWPAFAQVVRTYRIDPAWLHAMLDGQRDDLTIRQYQSFEQLYGYCYKVASVVGLTCVQVWGYEGGESTRKLAEYRGVALQLTNILRDVVEDAQRGRFYLPAEDFERFGYDPQMLVEGKVDRGFDELMRFQIERALNYYEKSRELERWIAPDCRATCWTIMRIYRGLLERIAQDPQRVLCERVRLSAIAKMAIGLRASLGMDAELAAVTSGPRISCGGEQMQTVAAEVGASCGGAAAGRSAVVVGGGLAGMAAALRLAQQGVRVTLVETRKRLGGRATSFADPATGQLLDNCQHVLMGCCTNLLDLYEQLGVRDQIAWHRRLYFAAAGQPDGNRHVEGTLDELEADDLVAPMHLARAMAGFRMLTWLEKIAISRAMLAMMRLGKAGRDRLSDMDFATWLRDHQQPAGAIEKFWGNIVVSACNELIEKTSAKYAIQVFQEGMLASEGAYVMGVPAVPLVQVYDRAAQAIAAAGGQVMLSESAEGFEFADGSVTGLRLADGRVLTADAYLSTVPFDRLAKLCPAALRDADARLGRLEELEVSPIIGIHLWYKPGPGRASVLDLPHVVLTRSPVQWLFNKGFDPEAGAQHLHAVISAAYDLVDLPAEAIAEMVDGELKRFFPPAREAVRVHSRVVKEKRATFAVRPGVDALRPDPAGDVGNLFLAGDWCNSGWPATMEGATRSGYLAAAAMLAGWGMANPPGLVAQLPTSWAYRLAARGG